MAPDRQEGLVRAGFWRKLGRVAGRVPFADELVAAWYCAFDPATPGHVKAVLVAALAYFVVPTDLIPDMIAGLGFTDDAAVLFAAVRTIAPHINDGHRERAREALDRLAEDGGARA